MKFNLKSGIMGLVIGCISTSGISVFAYNGKMSIEASFKNIRIFINGDELTSKSSDGKTLEPFIYNDSTYLPIRAIAEAIGRDVSWDPSTSTVYIEGNDDREYSEESNDDREYSEEEYEQEYGEDYSPAQTTGYLSPYQGNYQEETITLGGKKYHNSIRLDNGSAYYNLEQKYSAMNFTYAPIDGTGDDEIESDIYFYGDGRLLDTFNIKYGQYPKEYSINVAGVSQLEIKKESNYWGMSVGFGNIEFE